MRGTLGTPLGAIVLGAAGAVTPSGFNPAWAMNSNAMVQTRQVEA